MLPDVGFVVVPEAVPGSWQAKISGTLALLTAYVYRSDDMVAFLSWL